MVEFPSSCRVNTYRHTTYITDIPYSHTHKYPRMSHNIKDLLKCRHGILIELNLSIDKIVVSTHLPIRVVAMYILFGRHDSG
jgi:hypothetical protein